MAIRRNVLYLVMGLTLFIMSSGFLGMCVGTDYVPASIEITSPVQGTVFDAGTASVTIYGTVTAGDSAVRTLKANGTTVAFNSSTGVFSYKLTLDQDQIFTTCEFTVIDKKGVSNKQRVSYALGQSSTPGDTGVIDNAARILLTDSLLDQVEIFASNFMNTWKNDLIYGCNNATYGSQDAASPFASATPIIPTAKISIDDGMGGWFQLSQSYSASQDKGYINLGKISISTDIQTGNKISASINISPESWVNPRGGASQALFVQGHYTTYPLWIETNIHFTLYTDAVSITNVKVGLSVNSANKIVAKLDLSNADIDLGNTTIEFGKISLFTEDDLLNWIIDMVKDDVLSSLSTEMELVSINDLAFEAAGLSLSGWPMLSTVFSTPNDSTMLIDLGLSAKLADDTDPAVPDLTKFYSTLPNTQPDITMSSNENLAIAISDDLLNEAAFDLIQMNYINEMDVSSYATKLLNKLVSNKTIVAYTTLHTPPIFDFSGATPKVRIRDLYLDLYYKSTLPPYPYAARLCVDVDLDLVLTLSDDGTHIQASSEISDSSATIQYLYTNLTSSALLPEIGGTLAVNIVNMLLQSLVNFDIPTVDLYDQTLSVNLTGTEVANNCLVAKVNLAVVQ